MPAISPMTKNIMTRQLYRQVWETIDLDASLAKALTKELSQRWENTDRKITSRHQRGPCTAVLLESIKLPLLFGRQKLRPTIFSSAAYLAPSMLFDTWDCFDY